MDRSIVKVNQAMFLSNNFLYMHFQGHYDDVMLVVMNNKFKGFTLTKTCHQQDYNVVQLKGVRSTIDMNKKYISCDSLF